LDKLLWGRPSIDPAAGPGEHSKVRQVRLAAAANQQLDILRDALTDYLSTHPRRLTPGELLPGRTFPMSHLRPVEDLLRSDAVKYHRPAGTSEL